MTNDFRICVLTALLQYNRLNPNPNPFAPFSISYKQRFLDQNAFLVYYTKGFDGPGRESIETEDSVQIKQKQQYGLRNEAWIAIDDAKAEIAYLENLSLVVSSSVTEQIDSVKDLQKALDAAGKALTDYLGLAPAQDLVETKTKDNL